VKGGVSDVQLRVVLVSIAALLALGACRAGQDAPLPGSGVDRMPDYPGWVAAESGAADGSRWFTSADDPQTVETGYLELLREQGWVTSGETSKGERRVLSLVRGSGEAQRVTVFIDRAPQGSRIGVAPVADLRDPTP
jgi:hypothetical protein